MSGEEIKKKLKESKDAAWGGTGEVTLSVLEWTIKYIETLETSLAKTLPPTPAPKAE